MEFNGNIHSDPEGEYGHRLLPKIKLPNPEGA
jgi:hypothetical protein